MNGRVCLNVEYPLRVVTHVPTPVARAGRGARHLTSHICISSAVSGLDMRHLLFGSVFSRLTSRRIIYYTILVSTVPSRSTVRYRMEYRDRTDASRTLYSDSVLYNYIDDTMTKVRPY